MSNTVNRLREQCREISTRPFNARGSTVKRCQVCLLAEFACMCPWRIESTTEIEFILIMHRKEVYKTTNTGRLIADIFPKNTQAFLWDRTEPAKELLTAINKTDRKTVILFPDNTANTEQTAMASSVAINHINSHPLRVILLDGTWKQASRMIRLSQWLKDIPRISINESTLNSHYIRQAVREGQLSTAQAAASLLDTLGYSDNALHLHHYVNIFNQHCVATRRSAAPTISGSHQFLTDKKHSITK